jgi:hypothetical protein
LAGTLNCLACLLAPNRIAAPVGTDYDTLLGRGVSRLIEATNAVLEHDSNQPERVVCVALAAHRVTQNSRKEI